MAMGRSCMGKQMATAPASRKPKKMGSGGLAMISPAAALIKSLQSGAPEGLMKIVPGARMLADPKKKQPDQSMVPQTAPMAKGGRVRGDGCCKSGGTKGKMR